MPPTKPRRVPRPAEAAGIAKFRDPAYPDRWWLTDFTMSQVEGRLADADRVLVEGLTSAARNRDIIVDLRARITELERERNTANADAGHWRGKVFFDREASQRLYTDARIEVAVERSRADSAERELAHEKHVGDALVADVNRERVRADTAERALAVVKETARDYGWTDVEPLPDWLKRVFFEANVLTVEGSRRLLELIEPEGG